MILKLVMAGMAGMMCVGVFAGLAQEEEDSPPVQEEKAAVKASAPDSKANPYAAILARNVFGLVPQPPPPKPPNPAEETAATSIKLTGFVRERGQFLRALFVDVPKTPNPTNTHYYSLKEGERDGDLELVKIHEEAESADVVHSGVKVTVALRDNKSEGPPGPGEPKGARGKPQPGAKPGAQAGTPPPGAPAQPAGGPAEPSPSSGGNVLISGGAVQQPQQPQGAPAVQTPNRVIRTPQAPGGQPAQPPNEAAPFIPGQQ